MPVNKDYNDELIEEDEIHRLWYRTQSAEDPCEMSPDFATHYIYEHKPTGIEDIPIKVDHAYVFSNPTKGDFYVHYDKAGDVKVGLYNTQGQLLEEKVYQNLPAGANLPYKIAHKTRGVYFIKIQSEGRVVECIKIYKKD